MLEPSVRSVRDLAGIQDEIETHKAGVDVASTQVHEVRDGGVVEGIHLP